MLTLDHLVVSTTDLKAGAEELSEKLGVPIEDGGSHPTFGTHNRFLSLGPDEYLEVIAIKPGCREPNRPRWFALDRFEGETRLTNWVLRTDNLSNMMSMGATGPGSAFAASRDGMKWTMVVPEDGELALDGVSPAILEWRSQAHPCHVLPDRGIRLTGLELSHPGVNQSFLPDDQRVTTAKEAYKITATLETPNGPVTI